MTGIVGLHLGPPEKALEPCVALQLVLAEALGERGALAGSLQDHPAVSPGPGDAGRSPAL